MRRALLIGSLAVNVLLVSFIGVMVYKKHAWKAAMDSAPRAIQMVKKKLPEPDRAVLDQAYGARERAFAVAQSDYDKAVQETVALLMQPNLDPAVLRAKVQDAREKRLRVADLTIDTFVETITKISPEARRDLVKKFRMW
jgi:uncharacterized membrane protein